MKNKPIFPSCKSMLHGGDYNPDQWIQMPEIWDEDMRLMKLAKCNAMSIGIFAWSALEPEEGKFKFGWLDTIMDKLAENNAYAILATPSGSKPAWLSRAYPESCRVNADKTRQPHGVRHNHCRTSPAYREKCITINTKLAERYKDHPALIMWHVSNEYNGNDCHCNLCYDAFQEWLKKRYNNDIDQLNAAYWTSFWSHTFPDWNYIEPTDSSIHGLMLDWKRFKTAQTIDFFNTESTPLKQITPHIPITTNFMTESDTLDYWAFSRAVDVVSWDSYPRWHETESDSLEATRIAFNHDLCRTMKGGKPWMLMESVPSIPTRGCIKKIKEPGMHLLSSIQAIAHGSDTVQYFQWRKSRGGIEKLHGAVVDHVGHENTRVFKEVSEVGNVLSKLDSVVGSCVKTEVALIFDWENEWAINTGAAVYLGKNTKYREECLSHYTPFWEKGIPMDIIDQTCDLTQYKLIIAPMIYMLRPGFANRLKAFVDAGGTAVTTYWSAVVNESDLCFLGGVPGKDLKEVFGVWEEETQTYFPNEKISIKSNEKNYLGIKGKYNAVDICSIIHTNNAEVLCTYNDDFFADKPAITVNNYGQGKAYYQACRMQPDFHSMFYNKVIDSLNINPAIKADLPDGVTAQRRTNDEQNFIFLMNFSKEEQVIYLSETYEDLLMQQPVSGEISLQKYGIRILSQKKQ
jgi:beta-galactosidase